MSIRSYAWPLLLNGFLLFCIFLLFFAASNSDTYTAIALVGCINVLLLVAAIVNLVMIVVTMKSDYNRPKLVLFYTVVTVVYAGFFFSLLTSMQEGLQGFHPSTSP